MVALVKIELFLNRPNLFAQSIPLFHAAIWEDVFCTTIKLLGNRGRNGGISSEGKRHLSTLKIDTLVPPPSYPQRISLLGYWIRA